MTGIVSPQKVRLLSPFLKDAKEWASAIDAGSLFHIGIHRGKKLNFRVSVDVEYGRKRFVCGDLGMTRAGVRYGSGSMATRLFIILKNIVN